MNRHYPDFSPHDFSVFVKTVFANEILENRKRLIEYSKIPFGHETHDDDRLEVTATITTTSAIPESPRHRRKPQAPKNLIKDAIKADIDFENLQVDRKDLMKKSLEVKMTNDQPLTTEPEPEVTPSPKTTVTQVRPSASRTSVTQVQQQQPAASVGYSASSTNTSRAATAMVIVMMLIFAAGYLSFTNANIRNSALTSLCDLQLQFFCKHISKDEVADSESDLQTKDLGSQATAAPAKPNQHSLMVVSIPPGAHILIDGIAQGVTTPGVVRVPASEAFTLDVQLNGYQSYSKRWIVRKNGTKIPVTLERALLGYLDIEVIPNTADLFINGLPIKERPPLKRYAVPANTKVEIKAVNPFSKAEGFQVVTVPHNKIKKVTLYMKLTDNARFPSNDQNQK